MDFRKLRVYQAAEQLVKEVERLHGLMPRGLGDLWNQLDRCSASVLLNISEGASAFSPRRKAYFYDIARASAGETRGALAALVAKRALTPEQVRLADRLAASIIRMLTIMISNLETRS